jgi:hypothetical protein
MEAPKSKKYGSIAGMLNRYVQKNIEAAISVCLSRASPLKINVLFAHHLSIDFNSSLDALGVVVVLLGASRSTHAGSGTRVALTTALSILLSGRTSRTRCGSLSRLGDSGERSGRGSSRSDCGLSGSNRSSRR